MCSEAGIHSFKGLADCGSEDPFLLEYGLKLVLNVVVFVDAHG